VCRSKLQAFDEALLDVNSAIKLDPKSAAAYKCRFKIYQHMAQEAMAMGRDELDGNGLSEDEDEVNIANASPSRLLMMSARDALTGKCCVRMLCNAQRLNAMGGPNIPVLVCAAFVLGGSSNLMLAGEAEDAARESCRYCWFCTVCLLH
jgi:hypothetical protein